MSSAALLAWILLGEFTAAIAAWLWLTGYELIRRGIETLDKNDPTDVFAPDRDCTCGCVEAFDLAEWDRQLEDAS